MKPKGHASNPQVALLLSLVGERDWSLSGERDLIERVEDLSVHLMGVYSKKDKRNFHRPQGVVLNESLTTDNLMPLSLDEARGLIDWLKSLPSVEVYE